jgi:hypothetical protein
VATDKPSVPIATGSAVAGQVPDDCSYVFSPSAGHTTSWAQQSAAVAVAGYAAAGAYSAAGYHHPGSSSAGSDAVSAAGPTATTASSSQFPGYHQPAPPPAPPGVMPGQHCASHHQASAWTRHHAAQSAAKAVDVPTVWTDNCRWVAAGLSGPWLVPRRSVCDYPDLSLFLD